MVKSELQPRVDLAGWIRTNSRNRALGMIAALPAAERLAQRATIWHLYCNQLELGLDEGTARAAVLLCNMNDADAATWATFLSAHPDALSAGPLMLLFGLEDPLRTVSYDDRFRGSKRVDVPLSPLPDEAGWTRPALHAKMIESLGVNWGQGHTSENFQFYELLAFTLAEKHAQLAGYLKICDSTQTRAATIGASAVIEMFDAKLIDASILLPVLRGRVASPPKKVVETALKALASVVEREPQRKGEASELALPALCNAAPDVQRKAMALLHKWGLEGSARASALAMLPQVPVTHRNALAVLAGGEAALVASPAPPTSEEKIRAEMTNRDVDGSAAMIEALLACAPAVEPPLAVFRQGLNRDIGQGPTEVVGIGVADALYFSPLAVYTRQEKGDFLRLAFEDIIDFQAVTRKVGTRRLAALDLLTASAEHLAVIPAKVLPDALHAWLAAYVRPIATENRLRHFALDTPGPCYRDMNSFLGNCTASRPLAEDLLLLTIAHKLDTRAAAGDVAGLIDVFVEALSDPRGMIWTPSTNLFKRLSMQFDLGEVHRRLLASKLSKALFANICCLHSDTPSELLDEVLLAGLHSGSADVRWNAAQTAQDLHRRHLVPVIAEVLAREKTKRARDSIELSLHLLRDGYILRRSINGRHDFTLERKGGGIELRSVDDAKLGAMDVDTYVQALLREEGWPYR